MKKYSFKTIAGFTLVELMVTLAIAGILIGVAVPGFQTLISSNNASNAANRFANILAYARSEAITRAVDVTVCASIDGATCAAAGDTDWNNQWLVIDMATNELFRIEDVNRFALTVAVTDTGDNSDEDWLSSVCFNSLGEECNGTLPSVTFSFSSDGNAEALTLNSRGAVGIVQ